MEVLGNDEEFYFKPITHEELYKKLNCLKTMGGIAQLGLTWVTHCMNERGRDYQL